MNRACCGLVALVLVVGAGCAGSRATTAKTPPGVESAGLPYKVLRGRGGGEVEEGAFYRELAQTRAVCLGESHSNPHHHWTQLQIIDRVSASAAQTTYAVGMEMFQRPFQGVLDDFGAGRIDEATMRSRSGWKERWGFDYELYGPMIRLAAKRKMALIALNAAKELSKKISREGLDALTDDERATLPEMKLDDPAHRAWFESVMQGHPGGHGNASGAKHKAEDEHKAEAEDKGPSEAEIKAMAERMYSVQVLWDETMADTAAAWLAQDPARRLFILAGSGHCHDSAIVGRLKRRGIDSVVSVQPVIDDGESAVSEALGEHKNDFLFVMRP